MRKGRSDTQRDTAMYLCREAGERTLKEIGKAFGVKAAAAGHAVARVKRSGKGDPGVAAALAKHRKAIIRKLET